MREQKRVSDKSFLAGFVEGASSVMVTNQDGKHGQNFYFRIALANRDRGVLELINDALGRRGHFWTASLGDALNAYKLVFSGDAAKSVFELLRDYGIVYADRAADVLVFLDLQEELRRKKREATRLRRIALQRTTKGDDPKVSDVPEYKRLCEQRDEIATRLKDSFSHCWCPNDDRKAELSERATPQYIAGIFEAKGNVARDKIRSTVFRLGISFTRQPYLLTLIARKIGYGNLYSDAWWLVSRRIDIMRFCLLIGEHVVLGRHDLDDVVELIITHTNQRHRKHIPLEIHYDESAPVVPDLDRGDGDDDDDDDDEGDDDEGDEDQA
ncbi:hypothetical protein HDU93_001852 [Gonapodya sp. JEL0774]|nr:hypothetical protein HDU93_001852 [Gonapodya sp. JEL0774]